jgi:hypothetical protein
MSFKNIKFLTYLPSKMSLNQKFGMIRLLSKPEIY